TKFEYTATSSSGGVTFSWKRAAVNGIANPESSGNGENITEILTDNDTTTQPIVVKYIFTLSPAIDIGCSTTDTVKVTVNPTPKTDAIPDYTFCNGELAKINSFSSSSPDASFTWTNDNAAIGLADSGSGNILPFIATNDSTDAITGHITVKVTASSDNCKGDSSGFNIKVLPAPVLTSRKDTSICNNTKFEYTATSSSGGVTFSWTRPFAEGIKNEAGNGVDSTIKETLDNITDSSVTVNYIFSLSIDGGCKKYDTLRVTVYPTPVIKEIDFDPAYCNQQDVTNGIKFITPTWESSLTWKLAPLVSVGLPANGTGNISPFRASNVGFKPIDADINVSISVNNGFCSGRDTSFSFKVLPTPRLISATDTSVCDKSLFEYTPISSAVPTSFSWARSYDTSYITVVMNSADSIKDVLYNKDTLPHDVNYTMSLSTGENEGCKTDSIVTVTVNPTPHIHSINDYTFCNRDLVRAISFSSSSPEPSFTWSNDNTRIGLGETAIGDITGFIATNNNANLDSAQVKVTVKASSDNCPGTDTALFKIYVLPSPYLISRMTASVCDNNLFVDTAKSYAPATTFSWVRLPGTHISPDPGRDTTYSNVISESLHSDTSQPVIVQYNYMLSTDSGFILSPGAGEGCKTTESLLLTVNPTPVIDDIPNYTFCNRTQIPKDSISFHSVSPDASFSWTCDKSIGFGLSGIGNIPAFTASNLSDDIIIATITVNITAGSDNCSGPPKTFTITVNPSAAKPYFTSLVPYNDTLKLCNGSNNISFNVNTPINGTDYKWASSKPDTNIVHIKNAKTPNTVISFLDTGTYVIRAKATNTAHGGCLEAVPQIVIVSNTEGIAERNIFKKQPGNLLIYPDNSLNPLNGYQWGYDSVISLTDTIFGPPISIPGQVYQFFTPGKKFLNGDALNETDYLYWVSLRKGDSCYSKVYYNGPYAGDNIQVAQYSGPPKLTVIPNPNNGVFEIVLSGNIYGSIKAKIYNSVGQLIYTKSFSKLTQSVTEKFVIGNLAGGLYYIELYGSDLNKAASRFLIQH
ncbi:MAG TPA: hypothetical protein PLA68_08615, partial [Panacibacter sp.]|nr:hypothetical protein [Panacibacter sp.]